MPPVGRSAIPFLQPLGDDDSEISPLHTSHRNSICEISQKTVSSIVDISSIASNFPLETNIVPFHDESTCSPQKNDPIEPSKRNAEDFQQIHHDFSDCESASSSESSDDFVVYQKTVNQFKTYFQLSSTRKADRRDESPSDNRKKIVFNFISRPYARELKSCLKTNTNKTASPSRDFLQNHKNLHETHALFSLTPPTSVKQVSQHSSVSLSLLSLPLPPTLRQYSGSSMMGKSTEEQSREYFSSNFSLPLSQQTTTISGSPRSPPSNSSKNHSNESPNDISHPNKNVRFAPLPNYERNPHSKTIQEVRKDKALKAAGVFVDSNYFATNSFSPLDSTNGYTNLGTDVSGLVKSVKMFDPSLEYFVFKKKKNQNVTYANNNSNNNQTGPTRNRVSANVPARFAASSSTIKAQPSANGPSFNKAVDKKNITTDNSSNNSSQQSSNVIKAQGISALVKNGRSQLKM
eukprot:GDKJ01048995.1.p1 GENE.GDKJ01048995.1~~GDKJ01048995.1.p1  ORF type:complete len:462 (+),score=89.52 GDKJ01048995.1:48-1433(+)